MQITVNGEQRLLEPETEPATLDRVIELLGHHPRLIVVEFNGTILVPSLWTQQQVSDGDILEIVTIVGGGS
ncbi:MAG: sulfur carrier protein ThiS [Prochlorococcus sp.]|nr:sulfur carrier protein ThiS [Prochlorococcaceae cyanobacterium Fu_MAG_50]